MNAVVVFGSASMRSFLTIDRTDTDGVFCDVMEENL